MLFIDAMTLLFELLVVFCLGYIFYYLYGFIIDKILTHKYVKAHHDEIIAKERYYNSFYYYE